jgi:hypothetical protein
VDDTWHDVCTSAGLAACFLDHGARSYDLISRVFAGEAAGRAVAPVNVADRLPAIYRN